MGRRSSRVDREREMEMKKRQREHGERETKYLEDRAYFEPGLGRAKGVPESSPKIECAIL